jgi:crotonobetainyl-CoA:carnitine CoA-transferase CaiB-like acyl-CoA transferase
VNTLESLTTDPHLEATGFWQFVDHPTEGKLRMPSFPVNFGSTKASIDKHAPRLGEHTEEVLREAGLSIQTIKELTESRAALTAEQASESVARGGD